MRVRDFGRFDGPVVLFGGAYSNLQALEALAAALDGRPAVSTGDVVGYCADPVATVGLMRKLDLPGIAGNCERQVAEGAEDCGCGFGDGTACDLLSRGWFPHLAAACDAETVGWLDALPEIGVFVHQGRRYGVVHGGATAINRFLWPSSPDAAFEEEIEALERLTGKVDGVVAGHSGLAFHRRIGAHQWINAGAIGLPPHDGRPATRYAVLAEGEVVFERLDYDHAAALEAMVSAGLTQGYHETLASGLWPSEDVLPPELRRSVV
jgi:predicted phosphodiesterase